MLVVILFEFISLLFLINSLEIDIYENYFIKNMEF